MRALRLVSQLWVVVPVNPWKNRASSELLYTWDVGRTLKELVNHSPAARDLRILLAFYQHSAWFISVQPKETCGLLLDYLRKGQQKSSKSSRREST